MEEAQHFIVFISSITRQHVSTAICISSWALSAHSSPMHHAAARTAEGTAAYDAWPRSLPRRQWPAHSWPAFGHWFSVSGCHYLLSSQHPIYLQLLYPFSKRNFFFSGF